MAQLEQLFEPLGSEPKPSSVNRKRKWREIEQLKDKYQLERELKALDDSLEHMLEEF